MNKNECLEYIYSFRTVQKSSSHERIEKLLELFGNPHRNMRFIHVAGTNGKGSVSGALSSIFISAGYRTGLFTSPFVIEFGERIQIDGKYIDDKSLCEIVEEIKERTELLNEDMKPTVFEFTTVIALIYFFRNDCDIVILECGIGGQHDSTNVIPSPLAAVFTSISLDHTQMLGNTVEAIAEEKSGIIKEGALIISYPTDEGRGIFTGQDMSAIEILRKKAQEKGCFFSSADSLKLSLESQDIDKTVFTYKGLHLETRLWGDHQIANMITAAECALRLKEKGERIKNEDIEKGIKKFSIPCRMERIGEKPLFILDGGHNEGCMNALRDMIKKYLEDKRITLLMASMKDKNYRRGLDIILPLCENAVFTCVDRQRGEDENILKAYAEKLSVYSESADNPREALRKALSLTDKDGVILCCGSFYLAGDIRKILTDD